MCESKTSRRDHSFPIGRGNKLWQSQDLSEFLVLLLVGRANKDVCLLRVCVRVLAIEFMIRKRFPVIFMCHKFIVSKSTVSIAKAIASHDNFVSLLLRIFLHHRSSTARHIDLVCSMACDMMIVGLTLVFALVCAYVCARARYFSFIHSFSRSKYTQTHLKRQVVNIPHKCFSCDEPSIQTLCITVYLCAKMKPKKAIKITEIEWKNEQREERKKHI